jgi:hypothetical protein
MDLNRENIRKLFYAKYQNDENASVVARNINELLGQNVIDKRTA